MSGMKVRRWIWAVLILGCWCMPCGAQKKLKDIFSPKNYREIGLLTGFGHGVTRYNVWEGIYRPYYLIGHIGMDLTSVVRHAGLARGIFTLYNEPQFNVVRIENYGGLEEKIEYEAGLNTGLKFMYPLSNQVHIYLSGGTGPHFFTTYTRRQHRGFIFSDNFGMGLYVRLSEQWKLHVSYRLRHMSNINIWLPNNGINTHNYHVGISYFVW